MRWEPDVRNAVQTMGDLVDLAANQYRDRVYLRPIEPGLATLSFTDLQTCRRGCAAYLDRQGVADRARVVVVLHNSTASAVLFVSVIATGRVLVPINPKCGPAELRHILAETTPELIITSPADYAVLAELVGPDRVRAVDETALIAELLRLGAEQVSGSTADPAEVCPQLSADSDAEIVFTSGSTGLPKGVVLSHRALLSNSFALGELFGFDADEVFLTACPLFHNSGQLFTTLTPLWCGARTTAVRSEVAMLRFFKLVDDLGVTWSLVVNAYLAILAQQAGSDHGARPTLKGVLAGGSRLPAELITGFESRFGVRVYQVYGLTETTSIATCEPPDRTGRIPGSAGRTLSIGEIRLVDEAGEAAPTGASGEITFRGANLFSRYLNQPALTATVVRDGWLHTGDIGRQDAQGNLFILDRTDNLLFVGGENVYPAEVEVLAPLLPGVAEVVLLGQPDPVMGTELVLVYELRAGALADHTGWRAILAEHLSVFKVPRRFMPVGDLGLSALPRAANGKVRRSILSQALAGAEVSRAAGVGEPAR